MLSRSRCTGGPHRNREKKSGHTAAQRCDVMLLTREDGRRDNDPEPELLRKTPKLL